MTVSVEKFKEYTDFVEKTTKVDKYKRNTEFKE